MLATSAGLVATAAQVLVRVVHKQGGDDSLFDSIGNAIAPFLHYLFLGLVCHLLLFPKRPLRDSLGIALFAGAGPAVWTEMLSYAVSIVAWLVAGRPPVGNRGIVGALPAGLGHAVMTVAVCGLFAFAITFALAMSAVHDANLLRVSLSLIVAMTIAALIFGVLPLQWAFGPRPMLRLFPLRFGLWID
jgi:hypothetical protein